MSERLQWFRLYSEAVDDEKLRILTFEDRWHFIALLCCKAKGILDVENDALLQRKVAVKLGLQVQEFGDVVKRLAEAGLVNQATMQPIAWGKRQELDRPPSHEWRDIRQAIFIRDDFTCQYCGSRGVRLECDHIHPVSKGGSHDPDNLVTACFLCNRSKRDKTLSEWSGCHE